MNKHTIIHLFHIFFVCGLFFYIAIYKTEIPHIMYKILLGLGGIIIAYHSYLSYNKFLNKKMYWYNVFHVLVVGPLLVLIGLNGEKSPRYYFELLFMLAFATLGYHGYYLLQ